MIVASAVCFVLDVTPDFPTLKLTVSLAEIVQYFGRYICIGKISRQGKLLLSKLLMCPETHRLP